MTRLELLEAILFSDEYHIQDTKTLLIYVLERLDELEDNIDCLNEKIDNLILKL